MLPQIPHFYGPPIINNFLLGHILRSTLFNVPCSHHYRIQALKVQYVKNRHSKLAFHAPRTPLHSGRTNPLFKKIMITSY